MKILTVFGTRPEAIKMAPVVLELRKHAAELESIVCVTAQHRAMLDGVLQQFDITPHFDLDVMRDNQSLAELTGRVVTGVDALLRDIRPDWVLVQGDTTTMMASALAAFYQRVRVGHVEAGLRSHDARQPFPEEINRRLVAPICDLHFAPTPLARENLLAEGIPEAAVLVTGNTVVDAVHQIADLPSPEAAEILRCLGPGERFVLVTAHRRENHGAPLLQITGAIRALSEMFPATRFFIPVHPNPNVRGVMHRELAQLPNVQLAEPLPYVALLHLIKAAHLILTDSGGIQEEAPAFGVPVLVLRETTERPEGVNAGVARVVGTDANTIVTEAARLLEDGAAHRAMASRANPYGDGRASARIVDALLERRG